MQNVNYKVAQINGNPNVMLQGEGTHKQFLFPFEKSYDADAAIEMLEELEDVESRDEVILQESFEEVQICLSKTKKILLFTLIFPL